MLSTYYVQMLEQYSTYSISRLQSRSHFFHFANKQAKKDLELDHGLYNLLHSDMIWWWIHVILLTWMKEQSKEVEDYHSLNACDIYLSLMRISQTHHSLDPNNVNEDKLHEIGSCPHLIMQDFNSTLSFLLHIHPLPSHRISGVPSVLTHQRNGCVASAPQSIAVPSLWAPLVITARAFAVCLPAATHQQPLGTLPRCSHTCFTAAGCECF